MKHKLPCFQTSTGTFEANGRDDAYFVVQQILYSQNTITLAKSWKLSQRLLDSLYEHETRQRIVSEMNCGTKKSMQDNTQNKTTIGDVY
mmetsp:Transcript_65262/g.129153  ORF Transcript_65262/g.129153 Transcript_65262/m.129153 type:complete len:89 (-) Transcript_65262:17-283(-)